MRKHELEKERQKQAEAQREKARVQEKRRREAEAAAAEREREAEELAAQRRERFRAIQVRYGDALFAWRTKDEELTRYAWEHRHELLEPKRTKQIIHDYEALHADADFADWLRTDSPRSLPPRR